MGGGEVNWIAPQIMEENKAMEVDPDHVAVPATSPATVAATAPLAAPQVDEENKDEGNEGQEFVRKGKRSYIWQHFTGLPLTEIKGQHKAKCNHCCKIYSCHPTKHGTNSLNKHLKAYHKWIFTKVRKKAHFMVICLKLMKNGKLTRSLKGIAWKIVRNRLLSLLYLMKCHLMKIMKIRKGIQDNSSSKAWLEGYLPTYTYTYRVIEQSGVLEMPGLMYINTPAVVTTAVGQMAISKGRRKGSTKLNPFSESAGTVGARMAVSAEQAGCIPMDEVFRLAVTSFKVYDWRLFGAAS